MILDATNYYLGLSTIRTPSPDVFSSPQIVSKSQPDGESLPVLGCNSRFETGQRSFQALLGGMVALHRVLDGVPELSEKTVGVSEFRSCPAVSLVIGQWHKILFLFSAKSGTRAGRASALA